MRTVWRWAAVVAVGASLAACGGMFDPGGYGGGVNQATGGSSDSDAAMVAFEKGDYVRAESLAQSAQRANPKNPYALLVLAEVYQTTGRPELARRYYESLASLDSQAMVVQGVGSGAKRRPIADIARERLATLTPPPAPAPVSMTTRPTVAVDEMGNDPDSNVIRRFRTLSRLLEEGLITKDEYDARRAANLGALMPYSAPPPAAGLGRPAPAASEVVDRLKALNAAYQAKAISAAQQQSERTIILDALLPDHPTRRADAPPPLTSRVELADAVGRLAHLREAGVISTDEQARAQTAVYRSENAYEDRAARMAQQASATAAGMPAMSAAGVGVRLATYPSEAEARDAWAAMQKRFPKELGALQPVVAKVALRHGGTIYRLSAGPLADRRAAIELCRTLRRHNEACRPTTIK